MTYSQHIDVGLNLSYTITNLNEGTTYYFALTAENTQGASSGYSNEVSYSSSVQTATLTVTKQGNGTGTVSATGIGCGTDCSEAYALGAAVTLTATAGASSVFSGWSGGCGSSLTCTVTMNSNTTKTAGFNLKAYTITATAGANGSISPVGTTTVNYGANQTFTITPAADYRVASVTADGTSVGAVTSYTFSNVTANHNINVSFLTLTNINYSLQVFKVGSGRGTIVKNPPGDRFSAGTVVTLTATPNSGSEFAGWLGTACSGTNPSCTLTINKDLYITGIFKTANNSSHKIYLPLVITD